MVKCANCIDKTQQRRPSMEDKESTASIVDKGWNLVTHNTELLVFICVGFLELVVEAAGFTPFVRFNDLLPPLPDLVDQQELPGNNSQMVNTSDFSVFYKISKGVDTVGAYTVHISLATHMLLPFPVIMEQYKVLLVPWLLLSLFRSVLRELMITLVGVVLCSSHQVFSYPCVTYSALQGAQFCFIFYFWTSVHTFYHYLDQRTYAEGRVSSVINSIKESASMFDSSNPFGLTQQSMDHLLSMDADEEDDFTETTLVERAAMAWIVREILENDDEYVTDKQFSQYLVVKATMELSQALKELSERRKLAKKDRKHLTPRQRLKESLEFMRLSEEQPTSPPSRMRVPSHTQAFETSNALSRRDPIRRIQPLTDKGKPFSFDEMAKISGMSSLTEATSVASSASMDTEPQTEPSTHKMSRLLNLLEQHQQQRLAKKLEESRKDSF